MPRRRAERPDAAAPLSSTRFIGSPRCPESGSKSLKCARAARASVVRRLLSSSCRQRCGRHEEEGEATALIAALAREGKVRIAEVELADRAAAAAPARDSRRAAAKLAL